MAIVASQTICKMLTISLNTAQLEMIIPNNGSALIFAKYSKISLQCLIMPLG